MHVLALCTVPMHCECGACEQNMFEKSCETLSIYLIPHVLQYCYDR